MEASLVTDPAEPTPPRGRQDARHERGAAETSVSAFFDAFAPAAEWDELVRWPPDVFALANLVLDHTEGYRFVVAPPSPRRWPPLPDWDTQVLGAARGWAAASGLEGGELPELVRRSWDTVTRWRDLLLAKVRSGDAWELCEALLTLHSTADEACAGVVSSRGHAADSAFESRAWALLQAQGSLCRLPPTRVRIVPKTHFSERGITIRSLSRYLALCYESVDVRWRSFEPDPTDRRDFNIVLFPWPLSVGAADFRPAPEIPLENMDLDRYGFFEFDPRLPSLDCGVVDSCLEAALDEAGSVDAVILPEAAIRPDELTGLEETLSRRGARFLVAGVRQEPTAAAFGRNFLHFGVRTAEGWNRYEQDKHHRWCLDESQIRQYHLTRSLDPKKLWWEAIDIRERTLHVVDVGGGVTAAPLVCEDLARLDEVADLVRRIGPSLVIALLLDGPQLSSRWPCRYSSILADDPGAAVLTLTSYGMAALSRPPGVPRSRVVAHWNNRTDGVYEIELAPRSAAILMCTSVARRTLWTADGRSHRDVPGLVLSRIRQLRPARRPVRTSGRPAGATPQA